MKKLYAIIVTLLAVTSLASAQKKQFPEWADNPAVHTVPAEFANQSAVIILQDVKMDYRYTGTDISVYYTLHRIVKMLDERGIESFNKIEIPLYHDTKIESIKARTILPNGQSRDIPRDMIKVSRNEQGSRQIVMAMEGVEKNAEIELLVKEIKTLSLFGSDIFQYPVPVLNASFEMSYPKEMVFEEKGYNGFPDAHDTLVSNRRHISIYQYGIPALENEHNSYYDRYRMRAEYRIDHIAEENSNDKARLFTWDELAKRIHENAYTLTENEKKAVNKYLTVLGVSNTAPELEKIKKIESGIKSNIVLYSEIDEDNSDDLDSVISKRSATESGYLKLFAACLTQSGVKHELGITSDREEHALDSKFENWGIMENYVFYFPSLGKFLSPAGIYYRYPLLPSYVLGNKGVFCVTTTSGTKESIMSEIRTIDPPAAAESQENIKAEISFSKDMEARADVTYSYLGYSAIGLRESLALKKSDRKKLAEQYITLAGKSADIEKYSIANDGFDNFYTNTPVEITATVKVPQLVEKAGAKYLFKVGEVIGRQKELYQPEARKLPVDLPNSYTLSRTIQVIIPAGYKTANLEALRIHAESKDKDGHTFAQFSSDFKLTGNKLSITITEFYATIHIRVSDYEGYRKVVNAAADFNKVTLLMSR